MHIQRQWTIELDDKEIISHVAASLEKLLERPALRADWESAKEDALRLIQPAAIWDAFPIQEFKHDRLVLANGAKITGGPVTTVLGGATELVVAVCTVGDAISRAIAEQQQDGDHMRAMFLDSMGTWAVGQLRMQLFSQLEYAAIDQELHASTSLSPGESEWQISEQEVLFSLLDAQQIGVSLTKSMLMVPLKSLSLIMGIGPEPLGSEGGSHCDFCTIRDRCTYRQTSQLQQAGQ
jgi:Vitamin B12 dependent methionine synthase, activation domain